MAFKHLERFEAEQREAEAKRAEDDARRALRKAVREVIPRRVRIPTRPRGRPAAGGMTRKEVAALRAETNRQLGGGDEGIRSLEAEVQRTAIVILKIDGVLGTEPWRVAGGPHAGLIAANARLRYLENAARLLDDLRRSRGTTQGKLLEGVIQDADVLPKKEEGGNDVP